MDALKLEKWRQDFMDQLSIVQIEFDNFFTNKKIEGYFDLTIDGFNSNLELVFTDETLPKEIKDRLIKLLMNSKPEDSI